VAVVLHDVHPAAPLLLVPAVLIFARAYRAHMGRNDGVRRLTLMKVVSTLSPTFEETVDRPQLLSLVASVTNADVVDLTRVVDAPSNPTDDEDCMTSGLSLEKTLTYHRVLIYNCGTGAIS
jgi:hypothetical protein